MKKAIAVVSCAVAFCWAGSAFAGPYFEQYVGDQYISQRSDDYYFAFDIDLNAADLATELGYSITNSSLSLTHDATGFEWWNYEQLDYVTLSVSFSATDRHTPEAAHIYTDILWSGEDSTETVLFNAGGNPGGQDANIFTYEYNFTAAQVNGWEQGGWGEVVISAFNIPGAGVNNFHIRSVGLEAGTSPVPEPATMMLFGTGLAGLIATRKRRLKK